MEESPEETHTDMNLGGTNMETHFQIGSWTCCEGACRPHEVQPASTSKPAATQNTVNNKKFTPSSTNHSITRLQFVTCWPIIQIKCLW